MAIFKDPGNQFPSNYRRYTALPDIDTRTYVNKARCGALTVSCILIGLSGGLLSESLAVIGLELSLIAVQLTVHTHGLDVSIHQLFHECHMTNPLEY